jgi:hypothetical protein
MEDSLELASDFNMLNNIRISDFCHVAIIGTTYITFVPPAEGETKIACALSLLVNRSGCSRLSMARTALRQNERSTGDRRAGQEGVENNVGDYNVESRIANDNRGVKRVPCIE